MTNENTAFPPEKTELTGLKKIIYYFFWWMSGATIEHLLRFETEHEKYLSIGFTVFITGILAFLSGTGAFYLVFNSLTIAIVAGIIWGILIMNLDRYITITMKKQGSSLSNPDVISRISLFLQELIPAIPRIIIAIILGVAISTPLEVYLFKSAIDNERETAHYKERSEYRKIQEEIFKNRNKETTNAIRKVRENINNYKKELSKEISIIQSNIEDIGKKIKNEEEIQKKAFDRHRDETKGIKGTGIPGYGKFSEELGNIYNNLKKNSGKKILVYEEKKSKLEKDRNNSNYINILKSEHKDLVKKLTLSKKENKNVFLEKKGDLVKDIKILRTLIKKDPNLGAIHFIILSLIIIIELSPIIVKLLSRREGYEAYVDMINFQTINSSDMFIRKMKEENDRYII